MNNIETMKLALNFISRLKFADAEPEPDKVMEALSQAIEQAQQAEPCCYGGIAHDCHAGEGCKIAERLKAAQQAEPKCNPHPKAPHGFNRNASHSNERYTCECEGWDAYEAGYQDGLQKGFEMEQAQQAEPDYYGLTKDHLWMSITKDHYNRLKPEFRRACYTSPPPRQPLTDEEKDKLANAWFSKDGDTDVLHRKAIALIEEVEAAVWEKQK